MIYNNIQFYSYRKSMLLIKRFNSNFQNNVKIFMDLFNMSKFNAEIYIRKNPTLAFKETEHIVFSYNYCKTIGYSNHDILKNIQLITLQPLVKVQQYWALEETGCDPIHPRLLSRASYYFKKKIFSMKLLNFLKSDTDVVEKFLSYLNPPIRRPEILNKPLELIDDMTWKEVHHEVLRNWLKVRLKVSEDEINKLFRIHKSATNKSFRIMEENIQLAESVGITHQKLIKCGYLLSNYPEYPKTVLRDFPNLAGLDMKAAMRSNPKLMMIDPNKIIKIYGLLKEFGISDEHIQKKHQIFTMNIDTIKYRLMEIQRQKELNLLFDYSNVLHSVVHQKKISSRLSYLQDLKLRCASFRLLNNVDNAFFEDYIKEGKDINLKADLVNFLKVLFKKDKKEISKRISQHPFCQCVPLVNMQETYDYLTEQGYSKENIYKAIYILLYSKSKIEQAIEDVKCDQDVDFYILNQSQILNLAIYEMEKCHHFTGNGIWAAEHFQAEPKDETPLQSE